MQVTKFYKGFSTRGYEELGKPFDIYNVECVEEDLLNEIFTLRGERLYMPTFGTRIPLLVFEINDAETERIIREDLTTVFEHDPRVKLEAIQIIAIKKRYALAVIAKINYLEFNVVRDLRIEINSR